MFSAVVISVVPFSAALFSAVVFGVVIRRRAQQKAETIDFATPPCSVSAATVCFGSASPVIPDQADGVKLPVVMPSAFLSSDYTSVLPFGSSLRFFRHLVAPPSSAAVRATRVGDEHRSARRVDAGGFGSA